MMRQVMARTLSVGDVCYVTYGGTDYQCTVRDVANTPDWIVVQLIEQPADYPGGHYMKVLGDWLVSVPSATPNATDGATLLCCPHCGCPLTVSVRWVPGLGRS